MTARLPFQTRTQLLEHQLRLAGAELDQERRLRREAEREANRFHALLIAERIRKIPERGAA